ncbi:6-phosphogluconate dehydrogenase C-terminal domain-like protein [Hypoxylon sp. NC0597]|nr:6-phosphogluconate dehydrogenase C-terminal domain-like protein [Hypoxylon sp. NC0597]
MNTIRWARSSIKTLSSIYPSRMVPYSTGAQRTPPKWLQRVLEDRTEPPSLYAWTPENLPKDASRVDISSSVRNSLKGDDEHRRIYVLGVGNIGRLYASFLAKSDPRPPITLVVHRRDLLELWRAQPGIELVRNGKPERNADFDIEWWTETKPPQGSLREPANGAGIRNLIVATKAADALPQVDRLRGYLGSESTVAFTQNGMCKLWPPLGEAYVSARFPGGAGPKWLACVTTHGVTSLGPFRSVHASPANVLIGTVMGGDGDARSGSGSDYLAERIVGAPGLAARRVATRELWVAQLEKLVLNAVINPLTAVLRCKNGEIFAERNDGLADVMDVLLEEASRTLRALVRHPSSDAMLGDGSVASKPTTEESLRGVREELIERFSFERLKAMVYGVGAKVAENTSSMLQDVRAGKKTEIEDFNGWLVETARYLGDEHGLPAHEKLISLVVEGETLTRSELSKHFLGS